MKGRIVTRIGDVFLVTFENKFKKYFQYIDNDVSQLNSSVIKVFSTCYPIDQNQSMDIVINDKVDFYAHVVLRWGIEEGHWKNAGNSEIVNYDGNVFFRMFRNWKPPSKTSEDWYIWQIGGERTFVGKLPEEYKNLDIGSVLPAESVLYRMKTGKYLGRYPG